jgi:hypothetical protein
VLTNPASDPAAGIPELKVCAVRLERDAPGGSAAAAGLARSPHP